MAARLYAFEPGYLEIPGIENLRFNVQLSVDPVPVTRRYGGVTESAVRRFGSICFIPPNQVVTWHWERPTTFIQIEVFQDFLAHLNQEFGWNTLILTSLDAFNIYDEVIFSIGYFIENVLTAKIRAPKLTYFNTLAQLLVQHLSEYYPGGLQYTEGANDSTADKTASLVRAARFIREHLDNDLTIAEISKIANLSPFYFAKMFKSRFGLSPHNYLLEARLTQAQKLLRETFLPLGIIAGKCGFANQSHFTTTFHKALGITPRQFRTEQSSGKMRCMLPEQID